MKSERIVRFDDSCERILRPFLVELSCSGQCTRMCTCICICCMIVAQQRQRRFPALRRNTSSVVHFGALRCSQVLDRSVRWPAGPWKLRTSGAASRAQHIAVPHSHVLSFVMVVCFSFAGRRLVRTLDTCWEREQSPGVGLQRSKTINCLVLTPSMCASDLTSVLPCELYCRSEVFAGEVMKSPLDSRNYRALTLQNGMKVEDKWRHRGRPWKTFQDPLSWMAPRAPHETSHF